MWLAKIMASKKDKKTKGKQKDKTGTNDEEQLALDLENTDERKGELVLDVGDYFLRVWNLDGLVHEELLTADRVAAVLTSGPDGVTVVRQCERLMKAHRLGSLSAKQVRKLHKWIDKQ